MQQNAAPVWNCGLSAICNVVLCCDCMLMNLPGRYRAMEDTQVEFPLILGPLIESNACNAVFSGVTL